jgi:hypothetical protein
MIIRMGHLRIVVQDDFDTTIQLTQDGKSGESLVEQSLLRIRSDLAPEVASEVMLHELMHFAWHQTALPTILEDHEETIIRSLSPWLTQVLEVKSQ